MESRGWQTVPTSCFGLASLGCDFGVDDLVHEEEEEGTSDSRSI